MTTEKPLVNVDSPARPRLVPSTRFTLALLVFFAFIVQYSQRVNFPIGIICMVDRTNKLQNSPETMSKGIDTDNAYLSTNTTVAPALLSRGFFEVKKFHWNEFEQQLLLGAYWAGYIFTQIPGGWLATTLGVKWVFATSLGVSSLGTICQTLMYLMPNTHFILIFFLRFIIGLSQGVLFPATIALWSLWAVPHERSTLASIGFCGTHLGTSLTMFFGGLSCRLLSSGWIYIFLVTSILGFIWFALWVALTASSPQIHQSISSEERDYIIRLTGSNAKRRTMTLSSIPWKRIIRSKPVMALILTHTGNLFGLFFFLTNLGKISTELLQFTAQGAGFILASGFFLTYLSSLLAGLLTDYLVRTQKTNLTNARKFFNSVASFTPVLCMISLYFCDQSRQLLGLITILIFLACSGLPYGSGYVVNFADVVPAFSGIVFGVANTFASLAGFIGNMVAGIIVKQPILEHWRKLYIIFGTVYFFSGLVYAIYGSGEAREWATFDAVNNAAKQETKLDEDEAVPMTEQA